MVTPPASLVTACAGAAMRASLSSGRARLQRRDKMAVLDVVTERIEADLGGGEKDLRRADEPLRVVDKADAFERRGLPKAVLPYAQRFERGDRTGKQRRGAVIRRGRWRDEQRVRAGGGKRDRGEEPAGPPPTTATSAVYLPLTPLTAFLGHFVIPHCP